MELSQNGVSVSGMNIDFNNTSGVEECEVLITQPIMVVGGKMSTHIVQGYDWGLKVIDAKLNKLGGLSIEENKYIDSGFFLVDQLPIGEGVATNKQSGTYFLLSIGWMFGKE